MSRHGRRPESRRAGLRARPALALILAGLLLVLHAPAAAQSPPAQEYQIKAAFLYNFARFVEWPPGQPPLPGRLVFCIVGQDLFGPALEQVVLGKKIDTRSAELCRMGRDRNFKRCSILFISPSEKGRLAETLRAAGETGALTVSELEGFLDAGGMVNFVIQDNKVRFDINEAAARRRGFKISSRLLSLANRVIRDDSR